MRLLPHAKFATLARLTATVLIFCGAAQAQQNIVLVGTGSTAVLPLFKSWAQRYAQYNPRARVEYLPFGTSEGLKQVSNGQGDFGAGEIPLTPKDKGIVGIPTALIAIVPIYNLPSVHGELRLSGDVLARIYLGEIRMWNAPPIARLNPGMQLPAMAIRVVIRPAGKGSNYVFSEFLSKENAAFRSRIGITGSPKWPMGSSAERSSDMVEQVSANPGSMGYVELQYALKREVAFAAVLNPTGKFVRASVESLTAACNADEMPNRSDLPASLVNGAGPDAYPISSFTWLYVRTPSTDRVRAAALGAFLDWIISDGQQSAAQHGFAKLPPQIVAVARTRIKLLR